MLSDKCGRLNLRLKWCPNCKEDSVTVKVYKVKDYLWSGIKRRVEYCINKGCKHRLNLGDIKENVCI